MLNSGKLPEADAEWIQNLPPEKQLESALKMANGHNPLNAIDDRSSPPRKNVSKRKTARGNKIPEVITRVLPDPEPEA